ncbi:hypothetical protein [Bradyrhizobium ottawaense]|uniref:hypothetical protein n=1 Tax=Bradyrhizobium ottawaense TaxID=931866 RepID=UPI001FDAC0C2|nr:hypothetical protein [Bradyrhizobium ottawaense]
MGGDAGKDIFEPRSTALFERWIRLAVAACPGHHFSKPTLDRIVLVEGHGVEGDAHAGGFVRHRYLARREPLLHNLRRVHLVPSELFATLLEAGFEVSAGDLGENINTTGLDLERKRSSAALLIDA